MQPPSTIGEWVRYWYDEIGANVIPCNTITKSTWVNWKKDGYQTKGIHKGQIDKWLLSGAFNQGLGVICGRLWRGKHEGMYLVSYDFDNKLGQDEFCKAMGADLKTMAAKTIVEQNPNTPQKAHVYFISPIPFPDMAAKSTETQALSLEQKGITGLIFCTPSPRKDGGRYQIIGTLEPTPLPEDIAKSLKGKIEDLFAKYGIDKSNPSIPIEELAKSKTYAGDNRHEAVLRIAESLIKRTSEVFDEQDLVEFVNVWNNRHCVPPLSKEDVDRQWSDAKKFILRKLREEGGA